ncbi:hypothetical protein [Falsiroseomonas oryzae]|uniref:hypothetical protein n=1 Tax=Falsiroseomonas oryzae TaxID=2766473 RepID=UPI0022EB85AC|nr:hypothetical protein [Roseomonas sp. MO-31]
MAFLANLVTMPLVTQRAETRLTPGAGSSLAASEWCDGIAGAWGLKPQTRRLMERALVELMEVLAERAVAKLAVQARRGEDRVELTLGWRGPPLPAAATAPKPEDLLGPAEAHHAFAVWLATREAIVFQQRATGEANEVRLAFED